jgi:aminopeptidase N
MKATFALSVTIDAGDTAISNGRVLSDTPGPGSGKHTMTFAKTKRMSPYLVAMIVGDWECISGAAERIPVRICSTPDRKQDLGFALESTLFALSYFNRYFAVDYPFEKLDIIGVPDFAAGAMENTAAIVFRDRFLFVDENSSTEQRKQVAQYIFHEVAHQWFGDLVTMQWWDDIWLNEGFATWMERRPMDEWKPEWNGRLDEVRDTQNAMNIDTLRATRAIRTRVETPDEINQVFDAMAYQKTAAIIRMVEGYVGADAYREGINAYIKRFAYANASGEGLWNTIAAATKKPVDRIFSSYITQSGMPLVTVQSSCTGNTTRVSLSQKPISNGETSPTTWEIPVCYKRGGTGKVMPGACAVMSSGSTSVTLDGCSAWVFANVDGRGYYRTAYGTKGLAALGEAARRGDLTAVEQTSLLEDVWALVRLNEENIGSFLSLSKDLAGGGPSAAIVAATDHMNFVADRLVDDAARPQLERWIRETLRPALANLGWDPAAAENPERQRVRSAVLYTLGYAGRDPEVLAEARRRADRHLAGQALDPSLTTTILHLAAIQGDAALYERYLSRVTVGAPGDQARFRQSLVYFLDPALRQRTLDFATSGSVRSQDAPDIISGLMARPWAARATWEYVKSNWATLERVLGVFQGLPAVVGSVQSFCDAESKRDVEAFFSAHPIRGTERSADQALEIIDRCIVTRTGQSRNLTEFLAR